jgi:integrase
VALPRAAVQDTRDLAAGDPPDDDGDPLDDLYDDDDAASTARPEPDGAREDILEDLEDQVLVLSAPILPADFPPGSRAPPPLAAAFTGEDLVQLLRDAAPPEIPALALRGMVSTTHAEHRRILRHLAEELPADCRRRDLPTGLVAWLTRKRAEKKWRFSSLLKQLASLQGALVNLPLYRHTAITIQLGSSPVWRQAMRAAGRAARTEQPNQPKAMSWAHVQLALQKEPSAVIFAAVLLAWISCARTGCILQLTRSDLIMDGNTASITFRRGKGALSRRTTYTIHTLVPPQFLERLNRYVATRRDWLFPTTTKGWQVKEAVRRVDPAYECRSLRRGALQQLATTPGISDEQMLLFSGHSSVVTLRRYLDFGKKAKHTALLMAPGAAHLIVA